MKRYIRAASIYSADELNSILTEASHQGWYNESEDVIKLKKYLEQGDVDLACQVIDSSLALFGESWGASVVLESVIKKAVAVPGLPMRYVQEVADNKLLSECAGLSTIQDRDVPDSVLISLIENGVLWVAAKSPNFSREVCNAVLDQFTIRDCQIVLENQPSYADIIIPYVREYVEENGVSSNPSDLDRLKIIRNLLKEADSPYLDDIDVILKLVKKPTSPKAPSNKRYKFDAPYYLNEKWLEWADTNDVDRAIEVLEDNGFVVTNSLGAACKMYYKNNYHSLEAGLNAIDRSWGNGVGVLPLADYPVDEQQEIYTQWMQKNHPDKI